MSLGVSPSTGKHRRLFYYSIALVFVLLITAGIFAKNGWFPSTDAMSGKRTGWFGQPVAKNAPSSWNPVPMFTPTPTPLPLSKEYIYAGSRLLAVEDANASAVPPADLAIWRPSGGYGYWWVLNGSASGTYSISSTSPWGTASDKPMPGDYDGDGKTDFAIVRDLGSGGGNVLQWWILRSSDSSYYSVNFGVSSDKPVTADYDGDGKTDIAVWRESDGVWYIIQSSDNSIGYRYFGDPGDMPAPADFDGDGKADAAMWRNSTHTYYSKSSIDNLTVSYFDFTDYSTSSTQPVPADYDGDGKADYAVREVSSAKSEIPSGSWLIGSLGSSTPTVIPWQNVSDIPVQNDYDGDGKCDIAVWRDSTGYWYIRPSSAPTTTRSQQWGQSGDIPVPAYYRR